MLDYRWFLAGSFLFLSIVLRMDDEPLRPGVAAFLRHTRTGCEGLVTMKWKSWIDDSCSTLRWELRHVIPTIGFLQAKSVNLKDVVRVQLPSWEGCWKLLGFEGCFGRPRASLKNRDAAEVGANFEENEFWVSTEALCSNLLYWQQKAKNPTRRKTAETATQLFLDKVLSVDAAKSLRTLEWRNEVLNLCDEEKFGNICAHVRSTNSFYDSLRSVRDSHTCAASCMFRLFEMRECSSCAAQLSLIIGDISRHALNSQPVWGDFDLSLSASLLGKSGKKRRRIDAHWKSSVLAPVDSSEGIHIPKLVKDRRRLDEWKQERLRWTLASNVLCCAQIHTFSSCFDAGRVGKPAYELLLHHGYVHRLRAGIAFPPRVILMMIFIDPHDDLHRSYSTHIAEFGSCQKGQNSCIEHAAADRLREGLQ